MAGFFYNLGKMLAPKVRKGKWVWKSLTCDADDAIAAERQVGLDIVSSMLGSLSIAGDNERKTVSSVGETLAKRVANKKIRFDFYVYRDGSPNAFAVPGGFVFVSSSLLELYENNPDMSAFVIAHEMGHIIRRHSVNRLINSAAISAVTKALPDRGKIGLLLKNTGVKFFQSAYSQSQELEADAFGVKLMRAAGFEAKQAINALKKLAQSHKDERSIKDEYFSTHPDTAKRIEQLIAIIGR